MKKVVLVVLMLVVVCSGVVFAEAEKDFRGYVEVCRDWNISPDYTFKSIDIWTIRVEKDFYKNFTIGTNISTYVPEYSYKLGFIPAGAPDRVKWNVDISYRWNNYEFILDNFCTHFLYQATNIYKISEFADNVGVKFSVKYHF